MEQLIYNYNDWLTETRPEVLYDLLDSALRDAGYTIISFVEHHFSPQGYTCLWLLAESHLALHTFPEKGKSYIELSGCNKEMNELFFKTICLWKKTCACIN